MTNSITCAEIERIMALTASAKAMLERSDPPSNWSHPLWNRFQNSLKPDLVLSLCVAALRGIEPEGEPVAWRWVYRDPTLGVTAWVLGNFPSDELIAKAAAAYYPAVPQYAYARTQP
jgi:hypothetical protein